MTSPTAAPSSAATVTAPAGLTELTELTEVVAPEGVRTGRQRIDDLDARIIALISERIHTAAEIQAARIAEGGRRVDLRRETEIIGRYRAALGRPGTSVAMALLELCRGRI